MKKGLTLRVVHDIESPGHYTIADEYGNEVNSLRSMEAKVIAIDGETQLMEVTVSFLTRNHINGFERQLPEQIRENWTGKQEKEEPQSDWAAWFKRIEDAINRSERKNTELITIEIDRRSLADAVLSALPDALKLKGGR